MDTQVQYNPATTPNPREFVGISEVAILLDVARVTARRMVLASTFGDPIRLPNGHVRVPRQAVDQYLSRAYSTQPN